MKKSEYAHKKLGILENYIIFVRKITVSASDKFNFGYLVFLDCPFSNCLRGMEKPACS